MIPDDAATAPTYPMSFEQESIWLRDQFGEGRSRYLESWAHRLRGPVVTSAVEAALTAVVAHQEALRSRLGTVEGRPVQTVMPARPVPVTETWVTAEELDAAVLDAVSQPVPLDRPPLLRASLLRVTDTDSVLAMTVHHAVMDGWSARLLDEQISEGYRAAIEGRARRLPELPLQFGPYAQRQRHDDAVTSPAHLEHWRSVLTDAPAESAIPGDRPRPARPSHRGGEIRFAVDGPTGVALRRFARAERATPFVVIAAALTALLSRWSGRDDVVLGAPISRRTGTEVKSLLGCLTDVMPLRQRTTPDATFRELVASAKSTVWAAVRHRHIPYSHLVREFVTERTLGRFPLFQVVLTLDDEMGDGLTLPGVVSERVYRHSGRSKFDLFVNLVPDGDGYRGFLEYSDDLYDPSTARRIADRFTTLLTDAVARPGTALKDLEMATEHEQAQREAWAHGAAPATAPPLVPTVLRPHVTRHPGRAAAVLGESSLTYRELDLRSDAVARDLVARGCTGRPVAVSAGRSLDLPVAVLGILKAGAACLPLDPAQPAERTDFILRDAGARIVLTDTAHAADLRRHTGVAVVALDAATPAPGTADEVVLPDLAPDTTAYVLYTSGSTGRPKGVAMPHRSLANLVDWQRRDSACGPGARTLQFAPLTFDVAFQEIFSTWAAGGTLVLADDAARRDPALLIDLIHERRVERLILPFVALRQLAEHACADGRRLDSLREVMTSGEQLVLTPALKRFFTELTDASLQNQYGPTETHVVTALRLTGDPAAWPERPGIGRPVDGAEVRVRDHALRPQPIGVAGEICVGGVPLSHGYVGHAVDRRGGFTTVDGPDGPERLYRTGDLGRLLPDGSLEFLGRDDDQVKIRGYRVEVLEVEAVVKQAPGVADAVVLARPGTASGELGLTACCVPAPAGAATPAAVRAFLGTRLPAHLIPSTILQVDALPLTASGKTDRAALMRRLADPAHLLTPERKESAGTDRRSTTELRLTTIWQDLLGLGPVDPGLDTNFFHLGGDSLIGARLMLVLREEFGVRLGLDAVYSAPTISGLATLLDAGTAGPRAAGIPSIDPRLPADIVPSAGPGSATPPRHVLLTGATGFLGAFVLKELLLRTDATVHCLVRADDDTHARERLVEAATRYGVWSDEAARRTRAVAGDLGLPGLGLAPDRHAHLARTADAVYHCGASVNLALPYAELEAANVRGTEEVLRLAAAHRTVPVHHVSTVGVFSGSHLLDGPVTAAEPLTPVDGLRHGYAQSKWAAERLVRQAAERGLPVTVYRPTRISGDTATGVCQSADFLWLLVKGCLQTGLYPDDADIGFDLVPVDYVSGAVVALSLDPAFGDGVVHLADGTPLPLKELTGMLSALGYTLRGTSTAQWAAAVEQDPDNAAFSLLGVMAPEMVSTSGSGAARFDGEAARAASAAHGVVLRRLDEEVLRRHVDHFTATGFLPRPS